MTVDEEKKELWLRTYWYEPLNIEVRVEHHLPLRTYCDICWIVIGSTTFILLMLQVWRVIP